LEADIVGLARGQPLSARFTDVRFVFRQLRYKACGTCCVSSHFY